MEWLVNPLLFLALVLCLAHLLVDFRSRLVIWLGFNLSMSYGGVSCHVLVVAGVHWALWFVQDMTGEPIIREVWVWTRD